MRSLFAKKLTDMAKVNENIVLLSGDIGNRMFDEFKNIASDRFINCGIAESNMMSTAAGLALSGLRPFVYTITPFLTIRCLEQIKIGVAYHKAPVVIVGTGSGLSYGELGPTHHSLDDLSLLGSIPDIRILAPCDPNELSSQLEQSLNYNGPTYIRIGKKGEPNLYSPESEYQIGKANIIKEGHDTTLLGIGPVLGEAAKASEMLAQQSISLKLVSMGSYRPLDESFLSNLLTNNFISTWFTLEEHCINNGFGSSIARWLELNDLKRRIRLIRIGTPNEFIHNLGNQEFLRDAYGLSSEGIAKTVINEI
tara:strand:- start:867 stop:1793 length:927 start_codon:yes stop_codon:yes gene_type:complete